MNIINIFINLLLTWQEGKEFLNQVLFSQWPMTQHCFNASAALFLNLTRCVKIMMCWNYWMWCDYKCQPLQETSRSVKKPVDLWTTSINMLLFLWKTNNFCALKPLIFGRVFFCDFNSDLLKSSFARRHYRYFNSASYFDDPSTKKNAKK